MSKSKKILRLVVQMVSRTSVFSFRFADFMYFRKRVKKVKLPFLPQHSFHHPQQSSSVALISAFASFTTANLGIMAIEQDSRDHFCWHISTHRASRRLVLSSLFCLQTFLPPFPFTPGFTSFETRGRSTNISTSQPAVLALLSTLHTPNQKNGKLTLAFLRPGSLLHQEEARTYRTTKEGM